MHEPSPLRSVAVHTESHKREAVPGNSYPNWQPLCLVVWFTEVLVLLSCTCWTKPVPRSCMRIVLHLGYTNSVIARCLDHVEQVLPLSCKWQNEQRSHYAAWTCQRSADESNRLLVLQIHHMNCPTCFVFLFLILIWLPTNLHRHGGRTELLQSKFIFLCGVIALYGACSG